MASCCTYPEYVERMLAGSAVLRTKFPGVEDEETLGVLRLSEDLETLFFETSDAPDGHALDALDLQDVANVEISDEEISDCRLHVYTRTRTWRLEFPDARIFGDWSYGLQVLTVSCSSEAQAQTEISDLLREATQLNAKLLEDNLRLQRAVETRDALIRQLTVKQQRPAAEAAAAVFQDWHTQSAACSGGMKLSARGIRTRDA